MKPFAFLLVSCLLLLASCGGHRTTSPVIGSTQRHFVSLRYGDVQGPTIGETLSTTNGTWTNSPSSYGYQWQDCTGGTCTNISGATSSMYTVASGDVGDTIDVIVTAYNSNGSASQTSAQTGTVSNGGSAPADTVAPYFCGSTGLSSNDGSVGACGTLTGDAVEGQALTVGTGDWSNTPTSFSYQWQDCSESAGQPATVGSCSNISGATSASYTVQASDVGYALVPIVTATNSGGSTSTSVSGSCDSGSTYGGQGGTLTGTANADPLEPAGCSPISAVAGTTTATSSGAMTYCTNAPVTCGFPDPMSGNAGVPPGTTLTPGSISCSSGTVSGVYSTSGASISGTCTVTDSRIISSSNGEGSVISISGSGTLSNSDVSGPYTGQSDVTTGTGEIANINAACDFSSSTQAYDIEPGATTATVSDDYLHCADEPMNSNVSASGSYSISDEDCCGTHNEAFYFPNGTSGITETNDVFLMPWSQTAGVFGDSNYQTSSKNASNVHFLGDLVASAGSNGAIGLAQTETTEGSGNELENTRYSYINKSTMPCGWANGSSVTFTGNIRDDTAVSMGSSC